jgi:thiol:disulfide interchange protein DsbD
MGMRSKLRRILPVLAFLSVLAPLCAVRAQAQSFSAAHAKVSLVAENNAVVPGRVLWLGVVFDLERGWHTYWVNPGDSGEPPKIQWELPPGFRAGKIRWPVPARLGSATIVDYGYEGHVLLAVPLQVPPGYAPGKPLSLSAQVRYLVCSDVCIPAQAHPTLTIPAGNSPASAEARKEFTEARSRWPLPMPAGWKVQARDAGDHFVLSVETGTRESQASFFPLQDAIDNSAPQTVTPAERGMEIALKKSDLQTKSIPEIQGVLVLAPNRAVEITAPVAATR